MRQGDRVEFKRGSLELEARVVKVIRVGDMKRYVCQGVRLPVVFTSTTRWIRLKRSWGDA